MREGEGGKDGRRESERERWRGEGEQGDRAERAQGDRAEPAQRASKREMPSSSSARVHLPSLLHLLSLPPRRRPQFPVTAWGRVVAVVTMTVSLLVLSLPITIIGANFDEEYSEMRARALAEASAAAARQQQIEKRKDELYARHRNVTNVIKKMGAVSVAARKPPNTPPKPKAKARGGGMGAVAGLKRRSLGVAKAAVEKVEQAGAAAPVEQSESGSEDLRAGGSEPQRPRGKACITKQIHELIVRAHADAMTETERLMEDHEEKLRQDIRVLLLYFHHSAREAERLAKEQGQMTPRGSSSSRRPIGSSRSKATVVPE